MHPLLEVRHLRTYFYSSRAVVKAVDDVSFMLQPGERYGLIGESGSGKSTVARSILRLIQPPGRIESGEILLDGINLLALGEEEMRRVRLAQVAMISQGAMNSLNPVIRIRQQIADGFRSHDLKLSKAELNEQISDLLARVGLAPAVAELFPHQLSGGMKQRVCIAIAISLRPQVIIADEPTSALDVVVQRRVMQTLRKVQAELGAAVILIGHDMGLMAQFASRIGVMYGGKLIEEGPVRQIFFAPQQAYTQLLVDSLPSLDHKEPFYSAPQERPSGAQF
jgi:peptide/nickel transport system ATP-binding protein